MLLGELLGLGDHGLVVAAVVAGALRGDPDADHAVAVGVEHLNEIDLWLRFRLGLWFGRGRLGLRRLWFWLGRGRLWFWFGRGRLGVRRGCRRGLLLGAFCGVGVVIVTARGRDDAEDQQNREQPPQACDPYEPS